VPRTAIDACFQLRVCRAPACFASHGTGRFARVPAAVPTRHL